MSIDVIHASDWPQIMQLQTQVYHQVTPERVEVLQDKWLLSPNYCFVYRQQQQVLAYLLAHHWGAEQPPKLSTRLNIKPMGTRLFLHDLAVANTAAGQGVGARLTQHLLQVAQRSGITDVRLVSVQDSLVFWQKQGFDVLSHDVGGSYGGEATLMQRLLP